MVLVSKICLRPDDCDNLVERVLLLELGDQGLDFKFKSSTVGHSLDFLGRFWTLSVLLKSGLTSGAF